MEHNDMIFSIAFEQFLSSQMEQVLWLITELLGGQCTAEYFKGARDFMRRAVNALDSIPVHGDEARERIFFLKRHCVASVERQIAKKMLDFPEGA